MFDDLTDVYDCLVDWPKRLGHETPFYRHWFQTTDATRLLDAACGPGHHAAMFHDWGMSVEGADLSPAMIQRAKTSFGQEDDLRWVVRSFASPVATPGHCDVAICVGNSLALAPSITIAEQGVVQLFRAVSGDSLVILHVLNLWRLTEGPCLWQKHVRASLPEGDVAITKGVHRIGSHGFVNLIVTPLETPTQVATDSIRFLGLEAARLEHVAREAGAKQVNFFGGYQSQPYQRETSTDLVMVART